MHKDAAPQWRQDMVAAYERYTWGTWVVYKNEKWRDSSRHNYAVYDKRRSGENVMKFDTLENAQQYAEVMEAVGA